MARAPKVMREPSVGPSRSVEDIEAEFAELDRLSGSGQNRSGPDHLRLAPEPRRPAPASEPPVFAPPHMEPAAYPEPPMELFKFARGARRAAIFAAVMSTLAFLMSVGAVLLALVQLAA